MYVEKIDYMPLLEDIDIEYFIKKGGDVTGHVSSYFGEIPSPWLLKVSCNSSRVQLRTWPTLQPHMGANVCTGSGLSH